MAQVAREKALTRFREDKLRVLVATDVAARGIDVQGVSHVINYTCPEDEKTYIHRIGRTGRAGASGIAITFVDWADLHRWKMINKALDLPFDEPQETYSTSEHLFHDLGIAPGHQGPDRRPGPGRASPPRAVRATRPRASVATARRATERDRNRRRTRGGRPPSGARGGSPRARPRSRGQRRAGRLPAATGGAAPRVRRQAGRRRARLTARFDAARSPRAEPSSVTVRR